MTRPPSDDRPLSRRQVLGLLGTSVSVGLAGCATGSGNVAYGNQRTVDLPTTTGANASNASAASAAAAGAQLDGDSYAVKLDALALRSRRMVVKDDYRGAVVQGTIENTGPQRVELVEVRTRVYTSDGAQLGRYLDSTHDLAPGGTWEFEVIVLEDPSAISSYDIAVLGSLG